MPTGFHKPGEGPPRDDRRPARDERGGDERGSDARSRDERGREERGREERPRDDRDRGRGGDFRRDDRRDDRRGGGYPGDDRRQGGGGGGFVPRDRDESRPGRDFGGRDDWGPRRPPREQPPRRDRDDREPQRDYNDRGPQHGYDDRTPPRGYDERAPQRGYDARRDAPPPPRDRFDDRGADNIGRGYGNRHNGAAPPGNRDRRPGPPPPLGERYSPRERFSPGPRDRDERRDERPDDRRGGEQRDFDRDDRRDAPRAERGGYVPRARPDRPDFGRDERRGDRPSFDREPGFDRGAGRPPRRDDRHDAPRPAGAGDKDKRRFTPPQAPQFNQVDLDEPIRLNKYIARSTQHSRREADDLVKRGRVTVNGEIVGPGRMIGPTDVVLLDDKSVTRRDHLVYILVNKPKDVTAATTPAGEDAEERTLAGVLRFDGAEQLAAVHPLGTDMLGLQLVTNDPQLAGHFARNPPLETFTLRLEAAGDEGLPATLLPEEGADAAKERRRIHAAEYVDDSRELLSIVVRGDFPAEALAAAGIKYNKADRLHFAGLTKKDLPRGHWRFLGEREVTWVTMFQQ